MTTYDAQKRQSTIAGIRLLLSWLEEHVNVPLPNGLTGFGSGQFTQYLTGEDDEQRAQLAAFAFEFGTCEKVSSGETFGIEKAFGDVRFRIMGQKAVTCEAKVVGKKKVMKPIYGPTSYVEEWVDDIEYECPRSLLKALGES